MKQNVFIFRHYAVPPDMAGGTRHYKIARCMAGSGHRPFVFTSAYHHQMREYVREFDGDYLLEDIDGITFVWIKTRPAYLANDHKRILNMADYGLRCYRACVDLAGRGVRPDVVVGSMAHLFAVLSAWAVAKRLGARFWMDIGDLIPEAYTVSGSLSKRHPLVVFFDILARFLYPRAERILVLTPHTRDFLIKNRGIAPDRVSLFLPGIMREEFSEARAPEGSSGPFTVVYAGAVAPLYPVAELVRAAAELARSGRDIRVLVYGDGIDCEATARLARELGARGVEFHRPVPKKEVMNIMAGADALVLIERNIGFGFPNKLIDYMQTGRPVIAATEVDYGLPDEIFMKTPPSAGGIARAISGLMDMGAEARAELGRKVASFARERFDMRRNYALHIDPLVRGEETAPARVRVAALTPELAREAANIQIQSSPKSFWCRFGAGFFAALLAGLSKDEGNRVIAAVDDDGHVAGLAVGTLDRANCYSKAVKRSWPGLALGFISGLASFNTFGNAGYFLRRLLSGGGADGGADGPAELLFIGVSRKYRGQGVGKRLVEGLEGWFAERGYYGQYVITTEERNIAAAEFYRSLGARETFRRDVRGLMIIGLTKSSAPAPVQEGAEDAQVALAHR